LQGLCPICKETKIGEWSEIKEHVQSCRRLRQHPLLMRTCYCPYCLKRCSDYYALSSHIHANHRTEVNQFNLAAKGIRKNGSDGVPTDTMTPPFPFECTACKLSWPTANLVAKHFVTMEKSEKSCGGEVCVKLPTKSRATTSKMDD
ncbi:hypothetical protein PFISCL1PPCAC_26599, partial [Pristionchus fissidentatus]